MVDCWVDTDFHDCWYVREPIVVVLVVVADDDDDHDDDDSDDLPHVVEVVAR